MSVASKSMEKREIEDGFSEYYNKLSSDPNNISHWYLAINNIASIQNILLKVPETVILSVPVHVARAFFMDKQEKDQDTVLQWVKEAVMPKIDQIKRPIFFMKNGTFSDKYNASHCIVPTYDPLAITVALINLNYNALMLGAGGITELAIRECVLDFDNTVPSIYHGLPLRREHRVFYDFDQKKVLYSVNYWDWDYCYKAIARSATDEIVYRTRYPWIETEFKKNKQHVENVVGEAMLGVENLTGQWSVDIMIDESDALWLIDMAVAQRSAYWNN